MAKKKRIRGFFKSLFNLRVWFAVDHVRSGAGFIRSLSKQLISSLDQPKRPNQEFEQAVVEQGLSPQQVELAQRNYFRNALFFLILGVLFAINSMYLIYQQMLLSGAVSFAVTLMTFVFSLKSHFWYFQIKNRKLGCTFKEWYDNKVT
jgi:intracellular multiplication protein IcmV